MAPPSFSSQEELQKATVELRIRRRPHPVLAQARWTRFLGSEAKRSVLRDATSGPVRFCFFPSTLLGDDVS